MKNEFIGGLSARERTRTAAGVPAHAPRATSPDPLRPDPLRPNPLQSETEETEKDEALTLLADVYQTLQGLCERIIGTIGRG